MKKISKADLSIKELVELIKVDFVKTDKLIQNQITSEVDRIPELSNHIVGLGGKRLRPILTIACAKMLNIKNNHHITLAAAVELLHTATLLHDDVVDESDFRRGKETSHTLWDNKSSILVGDYLLGKAFQLMVKTGSLQCLETLSNAAAIIAEGEVLQLVAINNINIKKRDYIKIIESKTAALFSSACEVGGIISNSSKEINKSLFSFGKNLGTSFQLIDDALDYSGNSENLGKSTGDDFYDGKVTLPVIISFEEANENEKYIWKEIFQKKVRNKKDLSTANNLIEKHKSIEKTMHLSNKYGNKAKKDLSLFSDSPIKKGLINLVDFSLARDH
jgi:octaprenyl-diphosphate synthase